MAKNTMPKRIWLTEIFDEIKWRQRKQKHDDVEYVRADLAAGDANEPLADGQYRWIKEDRNSSWEPALVEWFGIGEVGDFSFVLVGEDESIKLEAIDAFKIGPVIRPPADTAN